MTLVEVVYVLALGFIFYAWLRAILELLG